MNTKRWGKWGILADDPWCLGILRADDFCLIPEMAH